MTTTAQQMITVSVQLAGTEYHFACAPSEQEDLRAAARSLDAKMCEIRDRADKTTRLESIAVMVALNLSHDVLRLQRAAQETDDRVNAAIQDVLHRVDDALSKAHPAVL